MNILGIGHDLWISSAALVRDGEVIAAICEERLNRLKGFRGFPGMAIDHCLTQGGTCLDEIDMVVCGWNPSWHMESPHPRFSGSTRWRPEYLYAVPNLLLNKAAEFPFGPVDQHFGGLKATIRYIDHQLAHAASAYYLSPFDQAAVMTADGRGERHTAMTGRCGPEGIETIGHVTYPHSLGLFYGLVTQYLGFKPHSDEWKVMALASYGSADGNPYLDRIRGMVTLTGNGGFLLDLNMCGYLNADSYGPRFYTPLFEETIGLPPRAKDAPITSDHHQLAHALQVVFEESMSHALRHLHAQTGLDDLVLAGGCMMNSVYNGRITDQTPFKRVFIPSCPDDSGIAVGAALWAEYEAMGAGGTNSRPAHVHNYWGPSYDDEIEATIARYKLQAERPADIAQSTAALIADGNLVGWYQGKMEFGQRALGNRSILADPRRAENKELVNNAVKFREGFRPFAPSILSDHVDAYFITDGAGDVPFMERVFPFREDAKGKVPAVVHVDGTGRLQTVTSDANPKYHRLISAFHELTGIPIILNTSFNLNGEAIVCTPSDAIRTFFSCGLDVLVLGDFIIRKDASK